ncbi:TetR/AcrR family transcriptional regulator [Leifsonia poae]|uniref:TetR/AcrR family transcriptional regulator n=1 Tax=Leifsonia poae TaxID=110933 RepID=UPI003D66414D
MANDTKERMVRGAVRLLATRGLQETSFSEVLEIAKAPRGSIYHHFPEGKEQLVSAAVDLAGTNALIVLDRLEGATAEHVTASFLGLWREVLTRSDLHAGCSVLAVTVATDSVELLDRAADVFRAWRARLAELMRAGGLSPSDALPFAVTLIAASEGAVVLSRAERSLEPFDLVAEHLGRQVAELAERGRVASAEA